jgi:hypothetical protein
VSCELTCPVCKVGSIEIFDTGDMVYRIDEDNNNFLLEERFDPDEGVGWIAKCFDCARTFEAEIDWDSMTLISLKGYGETWCDQEKCSSLMKNMYFSLKSMLTGINAVSPK